jgi:hypothetical protein
MWTQRSAFKKKERNLLTQFTRFAHPKEKKVKKKLSRSLFFSEEKEGRKLFKKAK